MNSSSRYNDDCDACGKEKKDRFKKEACPTIIKCSCPGALTIPAATAVNTTFTASSLTLNTSKLENPCAKIEFTSNLISTGFIGALRLQLFKQCSNQASPVPVGPSFVYSQGAALTAADTFTFFVCDCDSCFNDCCTYTLVITVTTLTVGTLAIGNATIGAIATCQACSCGCC